MIYIYNNYLEQNPSGWKIPFRQFIECIYHSLIEKNIPCKIFKRPPYSNFKLKKDDLIIMFQINFLDYHKKDHIMPLESFWKSLSKQVILIVSEPICSPTHCHLIKQTYNPIIHSIWDYSIFNMKTYERKDLRSYLVPNGYHPCLEYNKIKCKKDIDLLLYGHVSERRKKIWAPLKKKYKVVEGNFNMKQMNELLQRTKIVPIIFSYETDKCVDFYRLMPLLSNNCFVIHEEPSIEYEDTKKQFDKIIYEPYNTFVRRIDYFLNITQEERDKISNYISDWWKKTHHIKKYIPFDSFKV